MIFTHNLYLYLVRSCFNLYVIIIKTSIDIFPRMYYYKYIITVIITNLYRRKGEEVMANFYRSGDKTVLLELFGAGSSLENIKGLKANTTDAAVEKHLPVVTQEGNKITVAVSSVEHPMLPEHYIMGVYIETKNGGQLHKFAPGDKPEAVFTLADGDEFIAAYEYCNLHGLWKSNE